MQLDDLLKQAREIWPQPTSEQEIIVAMGVVYGDICRYVRDHHEGKQVDELEPRKELGNLIFSAVRHIDDLGFNAEECLKLAIKANENYAKKLPGK